MLGIINIYLKLKYELGEIMLIGIEDAMEFSYRKHANIKRFFTRNKGNFSKYSNLCSLFITGFRPLLFGNVMSQYKDLAAFIITINLSKEWG